MKSFPPLCTLNKVIKTKSITKIELNRNTPIKGSTFNPKRDYQHHSMFHLTYIRSTFHSPASTIHSTPLIIRSTYHYSLNSLTSVKHSVYQHPLSSICQHPPSTVYQHPPDAPTTNISYVRLTIIHHHLFHLPPPQPSTYPHPPRVYLTYQ